MKARKIGVYRVEQLGEQSHGGIGGGLRHGALCRGEVSVFIREIEQGAAADGR